VAAAGRTQQPTPSRRPPESGAPSRHVAPEGMLATRILAVVGVLVGAVGLATALVTASWVVWPAVMLAVAVGLVMLFVVTNVDWLVHYVTTKKSLISLNTVILAMVNFFSYRRFWRHDFSHSQIYQLSSQTKNILGGLKQPVSIVVFYAPGSEEGFEFGEYLRRLLAEYTLASSRVTTEFIRTDADPTRVRDLAKKYEVTADNTVVVVLPGAGEHRKNVSSTEIIHYQGGEMPGMPLRTTYVGETAITGAIKVVTETKQKKVYFVTGHKEHSPTDSGETGFSSAARLLRGANYEVPEPVNLLAGGVPEDCDLLIVAGPEQPFRPEEVEALARYLDAGKPALFLVDPVWDDRYRFVKFGFELLLEGRGVLLKDALVLDPKSALQYQSNPIPASVAPNHDITRELSGEAMVFQLARPLEAKSTEKGFVAMALLRTSPASWGEVNAQTEDTGQPTGGGPNVLEDTAKHWVKDQWVGGQLILVTQIPGEPPKKEQQLARIVASTETAITIAEKFGQIPDGQKTQDYMLRKSMALNEGVDLKGPLTLAAASSRRQGGQPMGGEPPEETDRLVVVGDADFASNNSVDALPGHQNLFLNSVSWLVGKSEEIGIRPKNPELTSLTLSSQQMKALTLLVLVAMPAAVILAGCVVWWLRRLD
jgi:ABC-type uncharacterized transport system involved in gliding motility auxiliary subunit